MVHIQYTFYYFSANKKYPLFSILYKKSIEKNPLHFQLKPRLYQLLDFKSSTNSKEASNNTQGSQWKISNFPSDYCIFASLFLSLLVLIADLFWWCFILGRCSFMSATKSVFICGTRPLALVHSALFRNEKRHHAEIIKLHSIEIICTNLFSV